jgi:hypothetical protein
MIRPVSFTFNAQTAVNNAFQSSEDTADAQQRALNEFDKFVAILRNNGVDVIVIDDTLQPHTPDSIFPNNWVSFHHDGTVLLYPMYAENRRAERKPQVLERISSQFRVDRKIDLSKYENDGLFLEGTGSMVLDRDNRIAYACLSPRTNSTVLKDFCKQMNYTPVLFDAVDENGSPIYHTNVMMCVADQFVVICTDSIRNYDQRAGTEKVILQSGKQIIPITYQQMNQFAGNMLQVETRDGEKLLIMSTQAFKSLNADQVKTLTGFSRIIHSSLNTIEKNGGGSARCMMAEVHLPEKL